MGPKCNDDKYYFNGIYYHFNPSSNSDLLNGVVTIAKIDDNNASSKSTYSSNKINELIDSVSGSSINDDVVSTETTYSSSKIVELINNAGFDMVVVDELPIIGERNTIYFVPSSPGSDSYDEYIYTDEGWEKIGTTGIDLTDYYTKGETDTLLLQKQDVLTAGTNISINSANTISALGYIYNTSTGGFSVGQSIENTGNVATAFGVNVNASGEYSHAEGWYSIAGGKASHAEGIGTVALNLAEHAEGQDNVSHKSSNVNGDSGNTLSSIGCDFDLNSSKNAREIMQNGDYYLLGVGGYDGIHIKGEDTGITVHTVQEVINGLETDVAHKQDKLTPGANITIGSTNTISAVDTTYTASDFDIKDLSDSTNLRVEWSGKQDKLTAGANITIDSANTISAVDTTYVASDFDIKDLSDSTGLKDEWNAKQDELIPGTNITIDSENTISAVDTTYVASDFDIKDLSDSTDLRTEWSGKQDTLTAGSNITIDSANTISAVDTTYTASDFDIKDLSDSTDLRNKWSNKQDALTQGTGISIDTANTISCTVVNTDTHRPIKVDGVEKLGDNVTPLNLSGGTNINLSTDSTGTVTINSVNTAYVAGDTITIDSANTINVANWFLPIGSITMWASNTVPEGWLLCNGQAISGDTRYTALRNILGTDTVPDLTGRFPLGVNGSHALNSSGGTETVTLTTDEMPVHSHEIKNLIHEAGTLSTTYRTFNLNSMGTLPTTVETLNPVQNTETSGGGQAHNNMPPYFAINFIIKYK